MAKKRRIRDIIKGLLFFGSYYLRFLDLLLKVLARVRHEHPCIILLYHRIVEDSSKYLNKGAVVHHRVKHFKGEIPYFKRNYQILSMDEVVDHLKFGRAFRRPSIAITFDDGYLDNYTLAYPFLKKHEVPATIFLTTSLIGTTDRTWTDEIGVAFLETAKEHLDFPALFGDKRVPIKSKEEKEQANRKVAEALKLRPDGERRELIRKLSEALAVSEKSERNCGDRIMLSWDEIREMIKNGITIGSHSHTHPILSRMPIEEAKEEIFNSKKVLERNLGVKIRHFSFPNGRKEDFSEELRDYCREIGFESICSVIYGANDASKGNVFALKRIGAISPVPVLAGELVRLFWKSSAASQHTRGQGVRPGFAQNEVKTMCKKQEGE